MNRKIPKIELTDVRDLLGDPKKDNDQEAVFLSVDQIQPFQNHPFQVRDDEAMDDLVDSIIENGILVPVTVRPRPASVEGKAEFEMISGHRRLHAAKRAGLKVVPALIRDIADNDAAIVEMIDSNMQREHLLPSERAFALKMKRDALLHQGKKIDVVNDETVKVPTETFDAASARAGLTLGLKGRMARYYIALTDLIPELLALVDDKKLSVYNGARLAHMPQHVQKAAYSFYEKNKVLRQEQVDALVALKNPENAGEQLVEITLQHAKPVSVGVISLTKKKLDYYFPEDYSVKKRQQIITGLLKKWKEENNPDPDPNKEEE